MRLQISLDGPPLDRLIEKSIEARRPIPLQAEVLLRQVLGFPLLASPPAFTDAAPHPEVVDANAK